MIIAGLQKLTLIDFPDRIACSLFLYGCNLRCGFCHNPSIVTQPVSVKLDEKEIFSFLDSRRNYLDGVCITGGEPLLSLDESFIRKIKQMGYAVKLDTNGCFPKRLKELIDNKLVDYVAMDIKASKENYGKVVGVKINTEDIEESIRLVSSLENYEFRTTFVGRLHDLGEIKKIAEWLGRTIGKKPKRYSLQAFRNSGEFIDESFRLEPDADRTELIRIKEEIRDYFGEVVVRG